ncbi:MAG TPA: glutaredoxin domain-containing protein [Lachnospiraceae bacterium]
MITAFVMKTCPDCMRIEKALQENENFEVIDVGEHIVFLKEFLRVRDNSPVFDAAKKYGFAGIPCFVKEDGSVTLNPKEVGL